jgi:hypothetical protein
LLLSYLKVALFFRSCIIPSISKRYKCLLKAGNIFQELIPRYPRYYFLHSVLVVGFQETYMTVHNWSDANDED